MNFSDTHVCFFNQYTPQFPGKSTDLSTWATNADDPDAEEQPLIILDVKTVSRVHGTQAVILFTPAKCEPLGDGAYLYTGKTSAKNVVKFFEMLDAIYQGRKDLYLPLTGLVLLFKKGTGMFVKDTLGEISTIGDYRTYKDYLEHSGVEASTVNLEELEGWIGHPLTSLVRIGQKKEKNTKKR